ncbi:MAG: FprA family A-type flavoprotein [Candidatus Omnitrophica bacterium]|nr:FprA family A-type flavoprotein [Candidatus Omnitrophota bacterium]
MVELKNKIYWVGAVDYNVRDFHGYVTPHGTSYNAYLIIDEKITLVDTVKKGFAADLLDHIREIVPPEKIDYLIVNHVEMDHSGSVPDILNVAKGAKIFCTAKGREGLIKHYQIKDREMNVVKSGDTLSLGSRTLKFIAAPMVHWPDSMFTYCEQDKVLLPNDAFGQHLASPQRFADEIGEDYCMEEATKYYANILMPLGSIISKKIDELCNMGVAVDIIGPSHGAIWRKNTGRIINAYMDWAVFKAKQKVVIVYDSMWDSTQELARRLTELIAAENIEVKIYNIRKSDGSQIVRDILDAKVFLVGSPTLNADMFWTVGGFLTYLRGLKPKNKKAGIFGSYGWAEGASKAIRKDIEAIGIEIIEPPFEVQYVPDEEELSKLKDYAKVIVQAVKAA